jgi:hypothetical protein
MNRLYKIEKAMVKELTHLFGHETAIILTSRVAEFYMLERDLDDLYIPMNDQDDLRCNIRSWMYDVIQQEPSCIQQSVEDRTRNRILKIASMMNYIRSKDEYLTDWMTNDRLNKLCNYYWNQE